MYSDIGSIGHPQKIRKTSGDSETRRKVRALRSSDLSISMAQIGRQIGISRQRVYRILREEGLPTKHLITKRQTKCYACPVCGTVSKSKFCCDECKNRWTSIPIVCSGCGKLFIRSSRVLIANYRHSQGFLFCSKQCAGKWLSDQYGFKRYPEHKWRKRKYDWDAIWKLHKETGHGHKKLSKQLDIPSSAIASILHRYQKMESNE